jgi:hypothetical protein
MSSAHPHMLLKNMTLSICGNGAMGCGKSAMAGYVAQLIEIAHFRLTRPFGVAYTRLTALSGSLAPICASRSQTDGRNL